MNLSKMKKQAGFTLIELMIVVAIIGILASVALPAYQTYTKKAKFTEVILASTTIKTAVEIAVQTGELLVNLDNGALGIPVVNAAGVVAGDHVATSSTTNGVITITGAATVDGETFILIPTAANGTVTWDKTTGSCVAAGLC